MNQSQLSNFQLYELFQNKENNSLIRSTAKAELASRMISKEEMQEIIFKHNKFAKPERQGKLKIQYKLLLLVFPFFIIIHNIVAAILLDKGYRKMNKQYWFYVTIGLLMWAVIFLLFTKYGLLTSA